MKKGMKGIVVRVSPQLQGDRLRVTAAIQAESGETVEAQMPDREVSAILPRSVLLGTSRTAPLSMLDTLRPILVRMTEGRQVRVWQYKERWFFSFTAWRGVRFVQKEENRDAEPSPGPLAEQTAR